MLKSVFSILYFAAAIIPLWAQDIPKPVFYLPFDHSINAEIAAGVKKPNMTAIFGDMILSNTPGAGKIIFKPGKVGRAYDVNKVPLIFHSKGNFIPEEGTCAFWLNPKFNGTDKSHYYAFWGVYKWGMLYKYETQNSLSFSTAGADGHLCYGCNTYALSSWKAGHWYHVACTWSLKNNSRALYVDGELKRKAPFSYALKFDNGPLHVGGGSGNWSSYTANSLIDEFVIWDKALDPAFIKAVYNTGLKGKKLFKGTENNNRASQKTAINLSKNIIPVLPKPFAKNKTSIKTISTTRRTLSLDGWWAFLPVCGELKVLPRKGWGLAQIPGYFTQPATLIDPNGNANPKKWNRQDISEFTLFHYQNRFSIPENFKGRELRLNFGGIDGYARIYLNGKKLGDLICWQKESFDITNVALCGRENIIDIDFQPQKVGHSSGIYGSISLNALPGTFIKDIMIQPEVNDKDKEIRFVCDFENWGSEGEYRIDFEISPWNAPDQKVKTFSTKIDLKKSKFSFDKLTSTIQVEKIKFKWANPILWSPQNPYLYRLKTKIFKDGKLIDEGPPCKFGFRDFVQRKGEFLLNGNPIHLRGHQVDLGWGNQMKAVEQIKKAGMNCIELAGPSSHSFYEGYPIRPKLENEILDYCDEKGIIVINFAPSAVVLKDYIFNKNVARMFYHRVRSFIQEYGNHPSICMWFMSFNYSNYGWRQAPSKIDGSYKPSDKRRLRRELHSKLAQDILNKVDPRPVFHHACGNFLDMFTLNCYIGPTMPLQEREEWPSKWAATKRLPLLAVEHGLILIPNWYRRRSFPLDLVYRSEPIFDELTAKYLGRKAYNMLTPEWFNHYSKGGLILGHPGEQAVKALFAQHSLRSWRTYGINGIIFNAINWEFTDKNGKDSQIMKALQRYFSDMDFYIAGPARNFPSKDHAYFSREKIHKQIVLLSDLDKDVNDTLKLKFVGADGKALSQKNIEVCFKAGQISFIPFELTAPDVKTRQKLSIEVSSSANPDLNDIFNVEVFPRPEKPHQFGNIVLYDTVGDTRKMLKEAGIKFISFNTQLKFNNVSLLIVGRKSYDHKFEEAAVKIELPQAVADGLNLLIFEQVRKDVLGIKLMEQSARRVFIAQKNNPLIKGLEADDFINLRMASDLMEAYPEPPKSTEKHLPKRHWKWGNRGIVSSFVFTKPHYAPFVPILECGFDIVDSPLLSAKSGKGRIVLCQVDVSSRYLKDPVSTLLINNLVSDLSRKGLKDTVKCVCLGNASGFLKQFGIAGDDKISLKDTKLIIIGKGNLNGKQIENVKMAVNNGATVLFLPEASAAKDFGLVLKKQKFFIGRITNNPLTEGMNDGDLYLKKWVELPVAQAANNWNIVIKPGLLAEKPFGEGRAVACQLDIDGLGKTTRGGIKALRFWNILLANLNVSRQGFRNFIKPDNKTSEENKWEVIPPFMVW